jgi:2,4-dienoyl-CoA reductase (NADPH2)
MTNDDASTNAPKWRFRLRTTDDLAELAEANGVCIPTSDDLAVLAQPLTVGGMTVPNRLAIQPMEGCDGDSVGRPGKLTRRRYERFAAGGAGLLWMEATAVVPEGRANPRQLAFNADSKAALADMVAQIRQTAREAHGHEVVLVSQLTHSGRYSKPEGRPAALMAMHHEGRDAALTLPRDGQIVTDDYLDGLVPHFVTAAKMAMEVGFDAVDVKACHGYLLNELLAAHTREGRYGGSFENRTRLMLAIVDAIRAEVPEARITTRLGIFDAVEYPFGWGVDREDPTKADLTEPKKLIDLLAERGLELIDLTLGNPYYKPHVNRPYNDAVAGGAPPPEHPVVGAARLIDLVGEVQQAYPEMAVIGSGYSWFRTLLPHVGAATIADGRATMIGAGRMAFAYPDFAGDILSTGKLDPKQVCVGCSGCTQMMRDGGVAGCVVRDSEVYGPIFRRGRLANREKLLELAESCRQCNDATCVKGCPAGIDIPQFMGKFLEGDEFGAYQSIRHSNIFPLVCAELCPVEQQCQGHCLQRFIGDGPLPIADIQRHLSTVAIENGWAALSVPEDVSGKQVAVVGAGPAGLACAAVLLQSGHRVTIFDRAAQASPGGMIESVIPADRVGTSLGNEIAAVFRDVPADRLTIQGDLELSADNDLDALLAGGEFDATFLAVGLSKASGLDTDKPAGVVDALSFLRSAKHGGDVEIADKRVAVIGGGNTAIDAALSAAKAGASDVYLIYRRSWKEMPAWSAERDEAMAAGVHMLVLTQPLGYEADGDNLTGVRVCPTVLGKPDESGRRRPIPQEGSAYTLEMDLVVEAIGQQAPADLGEGLGGVDLEKGLVTVDESLETSRPGAFAGGDIVRGPGTVVAAVADGMAAARSIIEQLK